MELLIIFFTLTVLWLIVLRITYLTGLFADWNFYLDIYIVQTKNKPKANINHINWMEKQRLKPYKYWWRLDIWSIKQIIKDPFLIDDIEKLIQGKYP